VSDGLLAELRRRPVLWDGAMGTEIFARGVAFASSFDELSCSRPELVLDVHRRYVEAGAELLESNTFGANRFRLLEHELETRVAEINRAGVELARIAAGESRRKLRVAGSIGPLGVRLAPLGRVQPAEARDAFREQAAALVEAGVDLLVLETFSDLNEIAEAIRAAREVAPRVPICAMMTFTEDGVTPLGDPPELVARTLAGLGADAIGANCSVGPARLLPVVERLVHHAGERPVAVKPNAGLPERAGARLIYPATPEYFADYALRFVQAGARLIGGCCGATPAHVRAMRVALDEARAGKSSVRRAPARTATGQPGPRSATARAQSLDAATDALSHPATRLQEKLLRGEFVAAVEVDPPRGHSASRLIEAARELGRAGVDVVNVADTPMARMRMSAWALAHLIQREAGVETVLHFPTRGRNLLRLHADLLAAHALGVRNVFVVMGDPPAIGDYPQAADHRDVAPAALLRMIKQGFNAGHDLAGNSIGGPTGFYVGAAINLGARDVEREVRLLGRKLAAGADFLLTQPVFDAAPARRFLDAFRERSGEILPPIIAGVLPLASRRNAEFLHNEVPGIDVPEAVLARMRGAADERREGIAIAREAVVALRPLVQGVYVMPMLGRFDAAIEVIETVCPPRR